MARTEDCSCLDDVVALVGTDEAAGRALERTVEDCSCLDDEALSGAAGALGITGAAGGAGATTGALIADPTVDLSGVDDVALGRAATCATGAAGHAEANGALIADPTEDCSRVDDVALGGAARAAGVELLKDRELLGH